MSELGGIRDRGENTLVPDLLGWMGAAFGDAVERAGVRRSVLAGPKWRK